MKQSEIAHFLKAEMEANNAGEGGHGTWHVIVGEEY